MSELGDWYNGIPFFTKWWFTLSVIFSLAGRIGTVTPYSMILLFEPLFNRFEIWRPVTALFFYPISPQTGFHFLINLYFLYNYSIRLESGHFDGKPADYCFMLIVNWISCVLLALAMQLPLLMDCMVLSVLYVWCQLNKDTIVTFWFGTMFKALYLPWVLFGFNFIIAGGGMSELIGIIAGHVYYFLKYTYPEEYRTQSWLNTPSFLLNMFPNRRVAAGFGVPPTRPASTGQSTGSAGGHNWGRGRVLGAVVD